MKNILLAHNLSKDNKKEEFLEIVRPFLEESDRIFTNSKYALFLRDCIENNKIVSIKEEDMIYHLNKCDQVIYGSAANKLEENIVLRDLVQAAKDTNKNYMIVSLSEGESQWSN